MRRLFLAAIAAILLPACGGEEATTTEEPQGGGATTIDMSVAEFTMQPSMLDVDPGSYVLHVVNDGDAVHALEVEGPDGEVETGELQPGESADLELELTEPGSYEMYCPVGDHRDRGMEGLIEVGGGSPTTPDETTTEDDSGGYYDY